MNSVSHSRVTINEVSGVSTRQKRFIRWLVFISALLMVIAYFVPVWQILMWAPQYPEGLEMKIWLYTITGDYKIISGLNHYIGMKHIEVDMFPEFKYMVYILAGLILFGLMTAFFNKRSLIVAYAALLLLAGAAGMVDFYQWGYDYGHNLDPSAAIVVPGMAYQPPLLGTKQLLNFTAYSGPDIGGYVFLVSGLMAIAAVVLQWRASRQSVSMAIGIAFMGLFSGCSVQPEPIAYGKDGCHSCKMTMMDERFGCEIVTRKGKIYKFDDVNCMHRFIKQGVVALEDIQFVMVASFSEPGTLIDARSAVFVRSPEIRSPMGSNIAAFTSKESVKTTRAEWANEVLSWDQLVETTPEKSHH